MKNMQFEEKWYIKSITSAIKLENGIYKAWYDLHQSVKKMVKKVFHKKLKEWEAWEKYSYKHGVKILKEGIAMGMQLRVFQRDENCMPDWCMYSCAGNICMPLMKVEAFQANVNKYCENQYS